jgi:hypothetical protein
MTPPSSSVLSSVGAVSEGKARALPNGKQMVVRMLVKKHHIREITKVVKCHKVASETAMATRWIAPRVSKNAELAEFSSGKKQKGGPILATTLLPAVLTVESTPWLTLSGTNMI